ncbi:MAG: alpha/beta hydrolase [Mycobacterium sp.]|nr:alpha/beta hydrolase [Mycobacterium sp.]
MAGMTETVSEADDVLELKVEYGTHPQQTADVFLPATITHPLPLVLLFHGGFWREKWDGEHLRGPAALLAAQGYVVANIEYRRVGEGGTGGWPNTLIDAATATDTLPRLIESLRPGSVKADAVVTVGHSAGGHLALWTALRSQIPEGSPGWVVAPPALAGAISLAGAVDLTEAHRLGEGAGAVSEFLFGTPEEVPDRYAAADPVLIGKAPVPVVLIHGELDEVLHVEMSRDYAARFGATLIELEGGSHMDVIDPEAVAWQRLLEALKGIVEGS